MRETETSAPSLGELSEAATPGRMDLQAFDLDCGGVPLIAVPDDIPVGGTPTSGLVAVVTLLPVEWPSDRNEADPRRAQANAAYLVRLWNDHRTGRLIHPTAMAEAVASARAEGYLAGAMDMRDTAANAINASAHRLFGEEADALCVAALGTATLMVRGLPLIPGGSSDV